MTALSRSPWRTRPRFCEYLALFAQYPVLAPEPIELFVLGRRQSVGAQTFIERSLLDPFADRIGRWLELARQLVDAPPGARQLNDSAPVLRRVRWMGSWHWGASFFLSPNTVHETGSTPQMPFAQRNNPV